MNPFLTLYTPTYKRPQGLARCMESVGNQTAVVDIEQIVIPDHLGVGISGMYLRVPYYASATHGQYVAFLCDDDVLASPTVVETVRACAELQGNPAVIVVMAEKGGARYPQGQVWPPLCGQIDLNCVIVRGDIWREFAGNGAYGLRYEGDFDFMTALAEAGHAAMFCPIVFSRGGVSRGAAEVAA